MPRLLALAGSACVAAWLGTAAPGAAPADPPDLSTKGLVAAASRYVAAYEKEFAFLLTDEAYSQTRTRPGQEAETRDLASELFLTFIPADNEWVAVRDVITVDGAPVGDRDHLRTLLSRREDLRGLIRQLVARNARYNIGVVTRNFNEPTLPLLLLEPKRVGEVSFQRKAIETTGEATLATLGFTERGRPTLVRGPNGSVPAKGEIVVEAGAGTIRRTVFELGYQSAGIEVRLRMTTEYAWDPKVRLWLPSVFTERYDSNGKGVEVVFCRATYSNYRRFEVTARIR